MKRVFSLSRLSTRLPIPITLSRPADSRFATVLRAGLCASVACGALVACTPAYDWRTVMNNDDGYEVTLPAKPHAAERKIQIAGQPMTMRMQTAETDDVVFAVGTVELPSADPALQRATLDYLQQGLARNVNAQAAARATQIDLAAGGRVIGSEMVVEGKSDDKQGARTIPARFVAKGMHVYQVAIVAEKSPPSDQADQFFSSFKLF
ncbi:hypothetical protein BVER_02750 [Candidatus Burkholderia verschuerenii]|uniref:Transmembrane protein n=1 Tax=Candidatus Burkholderia verschuerenii TaxID=242163 RepID=A0A0L0M4U4_9BURK|nr:hypothetical protein [Candidatus Burkholderia verschuerenii]KND57295.1 hypothetical protein BVER_02750 [Candidatus Burkholderia verschuerenii]